jgi:CBS domain containing-hemolysin-like protein
MFENALWKNPRGWAEKAVGTKLRFWIMLISHIFVGLVFAFQFFCLDFVLLVNGIKLPHSYFLGIGIMIGLMIFGPIVYLYALRKLLLELRNNKSG